MSEFATPSKGYNVLKVAGALTSVTIKCIIDERITVAPNMMYHSGKGSPHSHGTPVDVVGLPTTAGIPSTLNPLPRYCRKFQSRSRGNTADAAVIPQISLPRHSLWPNHKPDGRLPLLSAGPTVTSPAAEHRRPLAGTKYIIILLGDMRLYVTLGCFKFTDRYSFNPCWVIVRKLIHTEITGPVAHSTADCSETAQDASLLTMLNDVIQARNQRGDPAGSRDPLPTAQRNMIFIGMCC